MYVIVKQRTGPMLCMLHRQSWGGLQVQASPVAETLCCFSMDSLSQLSCEWVQRGLTWRKERQRGKGEQRFSFSQYREKLKVLILQFSFRFWAYSEKRTFVQLKNAPFNSAINKQNTHNTNSWIIGWLPWFDFRKHMTSFNQDGLNAYITINIQISTYTSYLGSAHIHQRL